MLKEDFSLLSLISKRIILTKLRQQKHPGVSCLMGKLPWGRVARKHVGKWGNPMSILASFSNIIAASLVNNLEALDRGLPHGCKVAWGMNCPGGMLAWRRVVLGVSCQGNEFSRRWRLCTLTGKFFTPVMFYRLSAALKTMYTNNEVLILA